MPRMKWDQVGEKTYETGNDRGVLYIPNESGVYATGVPWNGLVSVTESPSGAEASPIYADNIKYANLMSAEEYGATIEAYTYPEEFAECDGSAAIATGVYIGQQVRKTFGFSYRTFIGNDVVGTDFGYKIHLIYGAKASPSEKGHSTVNESPDAMTMSWELTTTPVEVTGFKPTACVTVDSTKVNAEKLKKLEDILYGSESAEDGPRLPLPNEIISIVGAAAAG